MKVQTYSYWLIVEFYFISDFYRWELLQRLTFDLLWRNVMFCISKAIFFLIMNENIILHKSSLNFDKLSALSYKFTIYQ